jgi:hypothetical protein
MTQEIIDMAQECGLIGMRPHLDGIYSEALVAFAKLVAERALADPMREVQRLGQEIEQEPICPKCKAEVLYECVACSSNNYPPPQRTWLTDEDISALLDEPERDEPPPQRTEQEPSQREFENWLRSKWTAGYACQKLEGRYTDKAAQSFWECWQAAHGIKENT